MSFTEQEIRRLGEALQADVTNIQQEEISIPEPTPEEETQQIFDEIEEVLSHPLEDEMEEEVQVEPEDPNTVVYDGPTTIDGLRDIVEELNNPNATPSSIDASILPDNTNVEQFISTYQTTGILTTNSTNTTYATLDSQPVQVTEGINLKPQPKKPAAKSKTEEEKLTKLTPEERKALEIKKKIRDGNKVKLLRARNRAIRPLETVITTEEMMILVSADLHTTRVVTTDFAEKHTIAEKYNDGRHDSTGNNYQSRVHNAILYDKNMNPLSIDNANYRNCHPAPLFPTTDINNSRMLDYDLSGYRKKFIIVDRESFTRSKGRIMKIKSKYNITLKEALVVKKRIQARIQELENFSDHLKNIINGIYDEANYEIVFNEDFKEHTHFHIYLRFPNLTVRNSIELEHFIEELLIRMDGVYSRGNKYAIQRSIYGKRTKFSITDAVHGYLHSHLPRGTKNTWKRFCMGSNHFMSRLSSQTDDLEFEGLMLATYDHISWESLEGGPYYKMESIGSRGDNEATASYFSKTIQAYSRDMVRDIVDELKTKDLSSLMEAFKLSINNNKDVTYVYDTGIFIDRFLKMFDEQRIKTLDMKYGYTSYIFNHGTKKFYYADSDTITVSGKEKLLAKAKNNISVIRPTYMNGEYIIPEIIDYDSEEITEDITASFHPDVLLAIMRFIHNKLLIELRKNGK